MNSRIISINLFAVIPYYWIATTVAASAAADTAAALYWHENAKRHVALTNDKTENEGEKN